GAGSWAHTAHHLADPTAWHKVDLVRSRDPGAPGGWRYEAHLLVLRTPYRSPATLKRRAEAAGLDRRAGIDVNVSTVAVVSVDRALSEVRASTIRIDPPERARLAAEQGRTRRRAKALERSRRGSNPAQYHLSSAQQRRAARRAAAGLPAVAVALPRGPRVATATGRLRQAYRRDQLSPAYRRLRGVVAAAGAARTRTRDARARQLAAEVVGPHGASLVVEDGDLRRWARRWGRSLRAFTPGRLVVAIGAEAQAVAALRSGTGLLKASTRPTALSQHCLCATRVPKTLADRTHHCPRCGLVGDRDRVAAALGAFVTFLDPLAPGTARVDYHAARRALAQIPGLQAALAESRAAPPERHRRRRDGRAQASARRRRAARQSAGSAPPTTPDEPPTARARGDHAGASVVRAGPLQRLAPGQDVWPGA
ncbi:MAG TPA: transposase, partial [Candidatus Dormibacteraeota bacterium]|nr:transposase [Candidatus Dormibacteraeota bacterium]